MCVHMFVLADARTHTLSEIQLYFSSTHCDLFVKGDSSVISSQRSKVACEHYVLYIKKIISPYLKTGTLFKCDVMSN